jgi:hypothetical protein
VEIEEGSARAALEQLDPPPMDGECALRAGRGYGVFHDVGAVDARQTTDGLLWLLSVAPTISQRG